MRMAARAMDWIGAIVMPSGEIPYIIDGTNTTSEWPYDTIAYVCEGVLAVDRFAPEQRSALLKQFTPTVGYLLSTQNADGTWSTPRSADQQRSPRVLSLLNWYLQRSAPGDKHRAAAQQAVARYLAFLLRDSKLHSKTDYGVGGFSELALLHTTSFVGLAVADSLQFGSTF